MTLAKRIDAIENLEKELVRKVAIFFGKGESISICTLYLLGATNRTLAQSRGFRDMISSNNFPCAATILRTQIDTAMRVNGLQYLSDCESQLKLVMDGGKRFNQLNSQCGSKMTDQFLRSKLEEKHSWIGSVYKETSDFVHLSFRHLHTSILSTADEDQIVYYAITGHDAPREENQYFEICDTFFEISKIASAIILGILLALHMQK